MMKKLILGFMGVAMLAASPVFGQAPQAIHNVGAPAEVVAGPGPVVHAGAPCAEAAGCCAQPCTICVPENYTKTTKKWVYCSGCEPVCLCYFRGLCCFSCGEGHCEPPHTRRFLIMKPRVCEECATRCVPVEGGRDCGAAPCGPAGCAALPGGPAGQVAGTGAGTPQPTHLTPATVLPGTATLSGPTVAPR
jgi:hypothetical protein